MNAQKDFIDIVKKVREAKARLRGEQREMKDFMAEHFAELHAAGLLQVQPNWYEILVRRNGRA